ncbi:DUF397 domain-containing protein [Streptosporangium sp. NPDC004631]
MAWCGATNDNCVEAATNLPGLVAVRDSKDPAGPALAFSPAAWSEFLAGVRNGDFCPKRDHGPRGRMPGRRLAARFSVP